MLAADRSTVFQCAGRGPLDGFPVCWPRTARRFSSVLAADRSTVFQCACRGPLDGFPVCWPRTARRFFSVLAAKRSFVFQCACRGPLDGFPVCWPRTARWFPGELCVRVVRACVRACAQARWAGAHNRLLQQLYALGRRTPAALKTAHTVHTSHVHTQVRYLKVIEKSGYQALPWVRYITTAGNYEIRMH
eukprot:351768-Chlamydomonas_euryale.AAC.3